MAKKLKNNPFKGIPITEDEICDYYMKKYSHLDKSWLEPEEADKK